MRRRRHYGQYKGPAFVQTYAQAFNLVNGASTNSLTANVLTPTRSGNALIISVKAGLSVFANTPTDSQGNTYVNIGQCGATGPTIAVFACMNAKALSTNDTVTASIPGGTQTNWGFIAIEFSGGLSTLEDTAIAGPTSGTSLTNNQNTPTTVAAGVAITALGLGVNAPSTGITLSPSAGWTQEGAIVGAVVGVAYQILSSKGTQAVTWSWSQTMSGVIVISVLY